MTLLRHLGADGVPVLYAVCDEWPRYGPRVDPWAARFDGGALRGAAGRAVEALTGLATNAGPFGDAGTFCFVSEATRRRLEHDTEWTFPCSTVVYSGIETAAFRPRDEPPFGHGDGLRLLYMGRFEAWKGVDTLLAALPLLPDATLECYGRGAHGERRRLEQLARDLGVADRVTFGSLERAELGDHYRGVDIVVFPSEWHEPFGLVPLEAMACGTPVVATGVGGSAEFLRDGGNCVLFAAGDAEELAAAVRRVRADAELRCRIVAGGLETSAALDVGLLADTFERWHVATASNFESGRPPDRCLALPAPATTRS
jgi:glycosyltransferase involved in cell wall biosynthesis